MRNLNQSKIYLASVLLLLVFAPLVSFAQGSGNACQLANNADFADFTDVLVCLINEGFVPMLFAIALAIFVWGVWQYMLGSVEDGSREKGKQFMIWGIVALTVMLAVWQLVEIFGNTFGFEGSAIPKLPE